METPPLTPAERVAQIIKEVGMTPFQFGKKLGISHQTLSNVLNGKNKPGLDTLQAISAEYPDAAAFLLTGIGEPFPNGRYGEKRGAPTKNTTEEKSATQQAEPTQGLTSGAATVAESENLIKLAAAEATIDQMQKRIAAQEAEIIWLRGKSQPNPGAAGPTNTTPATPIGPRFDGPRLSVQRRVKNRAAGLV